MAFSNFGFGAIEYLAIFVCGLSGGLAAVRREYDFFSILIIAWVTALGGGIVRDVMLGIVPPVGIADIGLVTTALCSGIIVAILYPEVNDLKWSMIIADALALGLFAVNGTAKAQAYHLELMPSVFLGFFTAVAGGIIRDLLLNEVPSIIRDKHLYAVPSLLAALLTGLVGLLVEHHHITPTMEVLCDIGIVILVFVLRIATVKFNWTVPGPMKRHRSRIPKLEHTFVLIRRKKFSTHSKSQSVQTQAHVVADSQLFDDISPRDISTLQTAYIEGMVMADAQHSNRTDVTMSAATITNLEHQSQQSETHNTTAHNESGIE